MTIKANPNPDHLTAISQILGCVCKDVSKRETAFSAIAEAIEQYRNFSHPYCTEDGDQRTSISTVAETRRQLRELEKLLGAVSQKIADLPLEAKTLLTDEMDAGTGEIRAYINVLEKGVAAARQKAHDLPDKSVDQYQYVMARDIAKALQDAGVKVSKTVPNPSVTGGRGGATFGQILQVAFLAAGKGSVALGPLIAQGIKHLNDPALALPPHAHPVNLADIESDLF